MRLSKGDLVKIKTDGGDPVVKNLLYYNGVDDIVGIILQYRYKENIYLFRPFNSPFTDSAYWVGGSDLLPYEG